MNSISKEVYVSRHAYEDIDKKLRKPVFNFIVSKFRTSSFDGLRSNADVEAQEPTQDTMKALWQKFGGQDLPDDKDEFGKFVETECKPFAFDVAKKKAIDVIRKWKRRQSKESCLLSNLLPKQQVICKECAEYVQAALQSLSARERHVLVLQFFEGLSHKEIADIMDATEAAVISLNQRARKKLKRKLVKLVTWQS